MALLTLSVHAQNAPEAPTGGVIDATHFGHRIDLNQHALFRVGDDPTWASPTLDDHDWIEAAKGVPFSKYGVQPGSIIWYRWHLQLPPGTSSAALMFQGAGGINRQVFVNGQEVGHHGEVRPGARLVNGVGPAIAIPPAILTASHGSLTIASRGYFGSAATFLPAPLFARGSVWLEPSESAKREQSYTLAHDYGWKLSVSELELIVGLCALALWIAMPRQREYLALAIWMLAAAPQDPLLTWFEIHPAITLSPLYLLYTAFEAITFVAMIEFVLILTHTRRGIGLVFMETAIVLSAMGLPFALAGGSGLALGLLAIFISTAVGGVVLPVLLLRAAFRRNLDARLVLLPFLVWAAYYVYEAVEIFALVVHRSPLPSFPALHLGSYSIDANSLLDDFGTLTLLLILLVRTVNLARQRAAFATEMAAAHEIQSLLLARSSQATPGFIIETEYRPAGEVGGDFFLISPGADGSLLAIVGDVSGKGIQAALRVSLILGTLNRETSRDPAAVLACLNTILLAQGEMGFTTACCVLVEPDGGFLFANAGHLNPYLDGRECASPGALPLGLTADATYESSPGRLAPGERLVLLSDGVSEARNPKGDLFGFDRTREAARTSAVAIADSAQHLGQDDDITVVALAMA